MGKHYSVSEKGRKDMRKGEMKHLRDTKGKYHMTKKDEKHMSEGMKKHEKRVHHHSHINHQYNHVDNMGKQPIGTEHTQSVKGGDTGKDANRKASDSFKRV